MHEAVAQTRELVSETSLIAQLKHKQRDCDANNQ